MLPGKIRSLAAALACVLSIMQTAHAQNTGAALRQRFIAACGKDFDLVNDEFKTRAVERGGGTYWLALVKPKHTGHFYLQYRYRESEPLEIREHELRFSVGPEGCRRGGPESGVYGRFCLGDTIIVPVFVDKYSGRQFKLVKSDYQDEKDSPAGSAIASHVLREETVANPAAPVLRYLGRTAHKLIHRIPGYTLSLGAQFQAEKPGRMNLFLTAEGVTESDARGFNGVPVIVLPRDAPATLIAGREEVRGYRRGADGHEYLASTSGNSYMTNVMILQPGDRITIGYFWIVRDSDYVGGRFDSAPADPSENLKPMITVRPFAPDLRYDFTEWIVEYLPTR
ncbi:MAG TPA: hypothetical protein VE961_09810 [Pyrinomonadaceae bacterium]|nr:hypothetical protein [Pyrinomonadaceae bacterium]